MEQNQSPLREEDAKSVNGKEVVGSNTSRNGVLGQLLTAKEGTELRKATMKQIDGVMHYVFAKIGLRTLPSGEEGALLLDHILQNYGKYTSEEVKLAFTLAMVGTLGEGVYTSCYEYFTCEYFSKIMNGYIAWTKKVLPKPAPAKELPPPPVQVDTSDAAMKSWLTDTIFRVRNDPSFTSPFMPGMLYNWLKMKGMFHLTRDEQEDYTFKAIPIWRSILDGYIKTKNDVAEIKRRNAFDAAVKEGYVPTREIMDVKKQGLKLFLFDLLKNIEIDVDAIP